MAYPRRSTLLYTVLLASAVTLSSIGNAQATHPADVAPGDTAGIAAPTAPAGPRVVQGGVLNQAFAPAPFLVPQQRPRNVGAGSNLALMGVGLAALIIGLTIDDDAGTIIAVGGGVLGLVGLYRYLR